VDYPSAEGHGAATILKIVAGLILFAAGKLSLNWQQARTSVKTISEDVAPSRKDDGMPRIVVAVVLVVVGGTIGGLCGFILNWALMLIGVFRSFDVFVDANATASGIGALLGAIGLPLFVDFLHQRHRRRRGEITQ
jgi:hypothetical protein